MIITVFGIFLLYTCLSILGVDFFIVNSPIVGMLQYALCHTRIYTDIRLT